MYKLSVLLTTVLVFSSAFFVGCDSGCPAGMREFNGECVLKQSSYSQGDPNIFPVDGDGGDLVFPQPTNSPQDVNDVPFPTGSGSGGDSDDPEDSVVFPDNPENIPTAEDDQSLLIWMEGAAENIIIPTRITDPNGGEFYNFEADAMNEAINDEWDFHYLPDSALSIFIPNTPRLSFIPGEWSVNTISVNMNTGQIVNDEVSVELYSKKAPTEEKEGMRISVNIWLVDVAGVDVEKPTNNSSFAAVMDAFKSSLETADISVTDIQYWALDSGGGYSQYAIIDSYSEYHDLLKLSASVENRWPNIFLIRNFDGYDLGGILGLAAHIPGPPTKQGSAFSGVAVATEYFAMYPKIIGLAMAHELAHWLGLFHTSEITGQYHDALDDTAQCSNDSNRDGFIDPMECTGSGAENIMFWSTPMDDNFIISKTAHTFSADQRWVLERNPVTLPH